MEYKIISGPHEFITENVADALKEGWVLSGGVSVAPYPDQHPDVRYAQALTRTTGPGPYCKDCGSSNIKCV